MSRRTVILRSLPGGGKSTYSSRFPDAIIVSADNFFTEPDGSYRWDQTRLKEAHAACLRKFVENIKTDKVLIVDNTNIRVRDIAVYYDLSEAYGRETEVVTLEVPVEVSVARNVHSVPATAIKCMADAKAHADTHFPASWKHTIIPFPGLDHKADPH